MAISAQQWKMQICFSFLPVDCIFFIPFLYAILVLCSDWWHGLIVDIIISSDLSFHSVCRCSFDLWKRSKNFNVSIGILHFSFLKGMQMPTKWNYSLHSDCWFFRKKSRRTMWSSWESSHLLQHDNEDRILGENQQYHKIHLSCVCETFTNFLIHHKYFPESLISFQIHWSSHNSWQPFNDSTFQFIIIIYSHTLHKNKLFAAQKSFTSLRYLQKFSHCFHRHSHGFFLIHTNSKSFLLPESEKEHFSMS